MSTQNTIMVPVAPAELMDKIAILEMKESRINDLKKLKNVRCELKLLRDIFNKHIKPTPELNKLFDRLRVLSTKGWDIEDGKRACERNKDFGPEFIEFAREAFKNNDERAAIKKKINLLLNSAIIEEKSYQEY